MKTSSARSMRLQGPSSERRDGAALPAAGAYALQPRMAGRTDVGLRRKRNEDTFVTMGERRLALVADGMGGRPCGDLASELAVVTAGQHVHDHAGAPPTHADPRLGEDESVLVDALHAANRRVHEHGLALTGVEGGMGTTLLAALFSRDCQSVAIAHVGDSRCYRVRDGDIVQLTRDHSLASELAERAPWLSVEALRSMPKNVLTRAIGLKPEVTVDITSDATLPGDIYLLCTDGLWGRVDATEMVEIVTSSASLDEACARLVDRANEYGGVDNITAVLVQIDRVDTRHASGMTLRAIRDESTYDSEPDLDWDR